MRIGASRSLELVVNRFCLLTAWLRLGIFMLFTLYTYLFLLFVVDVRLAHTSSELDAAVKRADTNESKVADAQRKAQEADHVRQVAVKENQDLKRDKKALEKQLAELSRQMEEETMARVEAQNALQSTVERNQFKENLHQQEIAELRSFQETHTTKITKELEEEYDCRLEEALENMRSQYGAQMDEIRDSAERKNADKIQEMKQHIERLVNESKKTRAEWSVMKTRYDDSQSQVTQMQKQNQHLQQQLRDAENGAEQLRMERDRMVEEMQAEIDALKAELAQIRDERQELIESRISLDLELQAYRKMLDAEEERLSPHTLSRPRKRARRDGTGTPSTTKTTTTHESSRMEQRTEVRMTAHQHVSGAVEITDIDPDGRFVRLANVSDHDVAMSGWQFKISSGSGETEVSHKFGRSFSLNPQGSCTVWANAKVAPSPMDDHDVLARPNTVRFPAPSVDHPTVRVVLSDSGPNAKVVADVEVKRETVIVGNEHTAGGSPNKNCLIM